VVDGQDVGMVEHPGRSRFLLEPPQRLDIPGEIAREDFDRDVAAEAGILRSVHLAHSARADGREDLVRTEHRARSKHGRESCHGNRLSRLSRFAESQISGLDKYVSQLMDRWSGSVD